MDLRVKNPTDKSVSVIWDGYEQVFAPGQVRVFTDGVAKAIVDESDYVLETVSNDVVVEPVAPAVEEPKVEEEVVSEPTPKKSRKKK